MAYPARAIADYFLMLAARDREKITAMKLQKLVYFAHGWYLALTGKPLINEPVEAWQWGPVIKSIYHDFKIFGSDPIDLPEIDFKMEGIPSDRKVLKYLENIWNSYGHFSALQLSKMTHELGTPWRQVWDPNIWHIQIPNSAIEDYFRKQLTA